MSLRPNMQETRERFKKISESQVVWSVIFLQCSEIGNSLFWDLPIAVRKSTNVAFHAVPAERRNKTLECWLATLNVSPAIMSHALEQINHWNKLELTYLPPARTKVQTSSARNVTHLEQIWAVECLLLGFQAQKKQCFVLDSWWMIIVTTEHGATCAHRKMGLDDLPMHHELRSCCMFLLDIGLYKVGLRLKASESSQRCEGRAVNSARRKKKPVVPCHLQ